MQDSPGRLFDGSECGLRHFAVELIAAAFANTAL